MSAKRLLVLGVPLFVVVSNLWGQMNEVSITAGRTFVSTQTVSTTGSDLHFGNPASVAFNYGRLIRTRRIFGIYGELPVAIYPRMDLNYYPGGVPKDVGALFVTPSVRVNLFPGDSVSPWVSAGGGYGRFREAPTLYPYGTNTGPTGGNTGVIQFGAGLDVWVWRNWGFRVEARDFYSGTPDLNVDTGRSRQHNYYVGVGIARHF
jgi:hypothetical protein